MWLVKENDGMKVNGVTVILDEKKYDAGLPQGKIGDEVAGYSFYALVEKEIDIEGQKKKVLVEEYITSDITGEPVLVAVTPGQYKKWKKFELIVKHATFVWQDSPV